MTETHISEIKQLLKEPKKIVIVPHKNPDGDAMGSTLGLCNYLRQYGHDAIVIAPNNYPNFLKWIPGDDEVLIYEDHPDLGDKKIEAAEIIFTLDFNALNRTGDMELPLANSEAVKILIDHHQQPDDYAKYVYSDVSMSSTSELVYHFIDMLGDKERIDTHIATCLYVGIMTDTGSFRFSSTTSVTHHVIADLIEKGANNSQIHINVYDTNSFNRLQLLGRALNNLTVLPEYNTAYIILTQDDLNEFDFKKGDTEGVVNYALSIEGVRFALIFIEHRKEGIIKISLRSKLGFDVNKFARAHFNGGGHTSAAGGRSELSLKDTTKKLHDLLPKYKNDLTI
jgi:phosphoesterase RecJ-like protein